jgi:predicted ATPase
MNAPDPARPRTPELDPLIGREVDMRRVRTALDRTRLVTITGPGASGKTRLLAAIVEQLRSEGMEAKFVDLSAVPTVDLVAPTVVSTLRLRGGNAEPAETVAAAFRDRAVVVALDNVEQIPEVGNLVEGWLSKLPELRILLTSRIPVGVVGEIEVRLETLSLPDANDAARSKRPRPARCFCGGPDRSGGWRHSTRTRPARSPLSSGVSTGCLWPWSSRRRGRGS